ncbi:MAG: hypothetical protein Q9M41_06495 [Paracoccaceae bacterium]|nr:hypothetical protein [Paracoccaceae bacterium]
MITDIWKSFRAMPLWVQIWVALILVPVNMASLFFVGQKWGAGIAVAAVGAMMLNLPIMLAERGLSKAMALPHVIIWGPLLVAVAWLLATGNSGLDPAFAAYLRVLLVVNLISLAFDLRDTALWLKGDRAVAGKGPAKGR